MLTRLRDFVRRALGALAGYPQIHTQAKIGVVVGDEIRRWGWSDARTRKEQVAAWLRAQTVTGAGNAADVIARLTRPGVLPYDEVDIHCMTELTFSHTGEPPDAGNIRMASGANKVCPINSKVRFWWHNGANVWRDWQP